MTSTLKMSLGDRMLIAAGSIAAGVSLGATGVAALLLLTAAPAKADTLDMPGVEITPYSGLYSFDLTKATDVDIQSIEFTEQTRFNGNAQNSMTLENLQPADGENAAKWVNLAITSINVDPSQFSGGGYLTGNIDLVDTLAAGDYRLAFDITLVNQPSIGSGVGDVPTLTETGLPRGDPGGVAVATPEASTWAMMLVGFAGLGMAGYRKSRGNRLAAVLLG